MKNLNPSQKEAVLDASSQMLIVAGAGTGKTSTIVNKISHLINNHLAAPHEIICLTFTDKAAQEMEERIDKELPIGIFGVATLTFHSFAERILRDESHNVGLSSNFKTLSESAKIYFLKKNFYSTSLRHLLSSQPTVSNLEPIIAHFSRLQDEFISPQDYEIWINKKSQENNSELNVEEKEILHEELSRLKILSNAYTEFSDLKKKNNYVDFGDLVYLVLKIFTDSKSILKKYRNSFKYIFVDEFQDTNVSQYELLKLLCKENPLTKLIVVGDDSQGIYKFRGATVSNILNFKKDFPTAKQVILNDNYRSSQPILDTSYKLIQKNNPDTLESRLGISKKLISHKSHQPDAVRFVPFYHGENEAKFIASEIKKLYLEKNVELSEILVLARAKNYLEPIKQALIQEGLPYTISGSNNFFKLREVRDLIAFFNILINPADSQSLHRVLSIDLLGINKLIIYKLESLAKDMSKPLFYVIEDLIASINKEKSNSDFEKLLDKHNLNRYDDLKPLLTAFSKLLDHQNKTRDHNAGEILYSFLESIAWFEKVKQIQQNNPNIPVTYHNITRFFTFLRSLESKIDDTQIESVVEYLRIIEEKEEDIKNIEIEDSSSDGVQLMTVHASKGLEFSVVFITNLSDGRFPSKNRSEKYPIPLELSKEEIFSTDTNLQEERRLMYVGMTRASDMLYLTGSKIYGRNVRKIKFSKFLFDIFENKMLKLSDDVTEEKKHDNIDDFKKNNEQADFEIQPDKELNLSYSHINDYELCPLKYKYKYLLNIPYETNKSANIGNIIHSSLQEFYKQYQIGKQVNLNTLLNLFEEQFNGYGFDSELQKNHEKEAAIKLLVDFYNNFHKENLKIIELESKFRIKIGPDVIITGKIDRIDETPDGFLEIIDYKTGKPKTAKEKKKDLQLAIYAYAVEKNPKLNHPIDRLKLSYYFMKQNQPITVIQNKAETEKSIQSIFEIAEKIKDNKFDAKPSNHCQTCEFRKVCNQRM